MKKNFEINYGENRVLEFSIDFDDEYMFDHISDEIEDYFYNLYNPSKDCEEMSRVILDFFDGSVIEEILEEQYDNPDTINTIMTIVFDSGIDIYNEYEKQLFEVCKYYVKKYNDETY